MTSRITPLLNRTNLQAGESLISLLVRLSALNHYAPHPQLILQFSRKAIAEDDSIINFTQPASFHFFSSFTLLPESTIYKATYHSFAKIFTPPNSNIDIIKITNNEKFPLLNEHVQKKHTWQQSNLPFCPYCLQENNYYRINWSLSAISACLRHKSLLVQGCPRCASPQTMAHILTGFCQQCGFDLRDSKPRSIKNDIDGILAQSIVWHWLTEGNWKLDNDIDLPDAPSQALYHIAAGLTRAMLRINRRWDYLHNPFHLDDASVFPMNRRRDISVMRSYLLWTTAITALLDWPTSFYRFLEAYTLRDQREPTDSIVDDLGYLYYIRDHPFWDHSIFDFLHVALSSFIDERYRFGIIVNQLYRKNIPIARFYNSTPYINLSIAAKRLRVSRSLVKRLASLGYLTTFMAEHRDLSQNRYNLVKTTDVMDLQGTWRKGVPTVDTARILGVSEFDVTDLIAMGVLHSPYSGYIERKTIDDLITSLRRVVRYRYSDVSGAITVVEAAQLLGLTVAEVIIQILSGSLIAEWPPDHSDLEHLSIHTKSLPNPQ